MGWGISSHAKLVPAVGLSGSLLSPIIHPFINSLNARADHAGDPASAMAGLFVASDGCLGSTAGLPRGHQCLHHTCRCLTPWMRTPVNCQHSSTIFHQLHKPDTNDHARFSLSTTLHQLHMQCTQGSWAIVGNRALSRGLLAFACTAARIQVSCWLGQRARVCRLVVRLSLGLKTAPGRTVLLRIMLVTASARVHRANPCC